LIGYYRVSTDRQGREGVGLDAQRDAVLKHAAAVTGTLIDEFTDVESGSRNDRPELARAIEACRRTGATLVVAKLDRLARNAPFLMTVYDGLQQSAGGVHFCDLPTIPPGPMGLFIVQQMASIAQLERGVGAERTRSALAHIKNEIAAGRGWVSKKSGRRIEKLGNPRLQSNGAGVARRMAAREFARRVLPKLDRARDAGCKTLQELADAMMAIGESTPSGGKRWSPEQVRRIEAMRSQVQA
jgi:DNA invertase Pin-like site-specific DNA recombinase